MKSVACLGVIALVGVCGAATAQLITFDEFGDQPAGFSQTTALRNQYAGLGVTFSGNSSENGGAILSVESNFGINPRSGNNFLAFNALASLSDGGTPIGPQTISFSGGASAVSIYGASGDGTTRFTMRSFDANNTELGQVIVSASDTWEEITLSGGNIAYVVITGDGDESYVMDDLTWTAIPAPSSVAIAGVIALGSIRRRR